MLSNQDLSQYVIVMETGNNPGILLSRLNQFHSEGFYPSKIVIVFEQGVDVGLPASLSGCEVVVVARMRRSILPHLNRPRLAYLPAHAPFGPLPFFDKEKMSQDALLIQPWIPISPLGDIDCLRQNYMDLGWVSTPALLEALKWDGPLSFLELESISRKTGVFPSYLSSPANERIAEKKDMPKTAVLSSRSSILALLPYFNCRMYLEQALNSLVRQSHPPNAIAVLDDASPESPLEIVRKFPQVTLLRSSQNVGPYRLLQSAIEQTQFDGYLFQDSDDWSSQDRLEMLLHSAEQTGAQWIGTQELMYFENSIHAVRYPLEMQGVRQNALRHPFCYPSSLISRKFLMQLGGFASGLRFSGDWELLTRAVWDGKVVNVDRYGYFRRIRKDSLITSPETGLGSPARREVDLEIEARKVQNQVRFSKGQALLLDPLRKLEMVALEHLAGPRW